ncbi:ABC transporter ATP-binding protein [Spongisporangium articulatum]|uniref:ABC transporter ATP-binding protein n=1 Tax=Spongisporangium articulatum TaxID=3362603 RepID=A0ABW8AP41_9ACTN
MSADRTVQAVDPVDAVAMGVETDLPTDVPLLCRGLGKRYGSMQALDGLDLRIGPGDVVGYLGPNGSGKTTTLRLLTGALRPSEGSASLFGHDCWSDRRRAHERLGYVPSEPDYDPRLTGAELLSLSGRLRGRDRAADREARKRTVQRLGIDTGRRVGELSRGNRQKLALALALWHRPDVLLLDEPSTGLDPLAQDVMHDLVTGAADDGAAVLFSSHVLSEVQQLARRVVLLHHGRVIDRADMAELWRRTPHRLKAIVATAAQAVDLAEALGHTPGVGAVEVEDRTVRCRFSSTVMNDVVHTLAARPVLDLSVEDTSLDEWFDDALDGFTRARAHGGGGR